MKRLHWFSKIRQLWAATFFFVLLMFWNNRDFANTSNWVYAAVIGAWFIVPWIITWPWWFASKYEIKPDEVVFQYGVLMRRTRTIRRDRIQSVNIEVNILSRILGQVEVVIEAAGSGDSNIQLQFVSKAEAENIRAQLRGAAAASEAEQPDDAAELSDAGLADAGERAVLAPATDYDDADLDFTQGEVDDVDKIPVDTGVSDSVFASVGVQKGHKSVVVTEANTSQNLKVVLGYAVRYFLYVIAMLLTAIFWTNYALALLIPLIGGAILHVDKVMNLRVEVGEKVVLKAGVLRTSRQSFKKSKIQAVELRKPPLWRPFAWWEISVSVLGEDLLEQRIIASAINWQQAQYVVQQLAGEVDLTTKKLQSPKISWWVSPLDYRQQAVSFYEKLVVVHTGLFGRKIVLAGWPEFQGLKEFYNPMHQVLQLKTIVLCKPTLSSDVRLPELSERKAEELIAVLRAHYCKDSELAAQPERLHS